MSKKADEKTNPKAPNTSDLDRDAPTRPLPEAQATMPPQKVPDTADVRAGPGDAGATHQPTQLPPTAEKNRRFDGIGRIVLIVGIAVPVILILVALF